MRWLILSAVIAFAGCASENWPSPDRAVHYGAVARAELALLKEGDTAADVVRKFGHPVGEIPLPWFTYDCFEEEGKRLVFYFDTRPRRGLRPSDKLVSVVLFTREDKEAGTVLWKQPERNRPNQALQHNDPSCHAPCMRTCRASRGRG